MYSVRSGFLRRVDFDMQCCTSGFFMIFSATVFVRWRSFGSLLQRTEGKFFVTVGIGHNTDNIDFLANQLWPMVFIRQNSEVSMYFLSTALCNECTFNIQSAKSVFCFDEWVSGVSIY